MNYLYYGDNLEILRKYIKDESVDLIYLDPPFKSDQSYNILFQERNGTKSRAQIKAFEDTWRWDLTAEETWTEIVEKSSNRRLADLMVAMKKFLGTNDMMAYLVMMAIRLQELYRVLKSTGSIYLHCDPTASHYLKMVMDAVFGIKNFKNEVVWFKNSGGIGRRTFSRRHEIIFFYAKTKRHFYDGKAVGDLREQNEGTFGGYFGVDKNGRKYREVRKAGRVYKYYMDEPKNPDDVWMVPQIPERDKTERLGYPTQKPEALLERIIKASSNEGDVVLDPFCGCGTTLVVTERLKRRWIGIDITHLAVALMEYRLKDTFGDSVKYEVRGIPTSVKDAEDLAGRDRFQFQSWALSLIKAKPEPSDVADRGIDGRIYFHDDPEVKKIKEIIIQVKSGGVNPGIVRDLKGAVEREKAQIGVLITLKEPTRGMTEEAVSSGFYRSPMNKQYPKIQILTIEELFNGKGIKRPPEGISAIDRTFKKAKRHKAKQGEQGEML